MKSRAVLQLRDTSNLRKRLVEAKKKTGMSQSEFIRRAVLEKLDRVGVKS